MNRKKGTKSQLITVVLSIALITTSISPREVEASWFSDLVAGMFIIITSPIWVFCPDNPTFRKNNPFRQKEWEEEPVNEYNPPARFPKNKTYDEIRDELQKEQDERFKKYQAALSSTIASLQEENKELRNDTQVLKTLFAALDDKLPPEELETMILNIMSSNPDRFRGADGKDGRDGEKGEKGDRGENGRDGTDGQSFNLEEFKKDLPTIIKDLYKTNEEFRQWFIRIVIRILYQPKPTAPPNPYKK
jgi:hypothetical protein